MELLALSFVKVIHVNETNDILSFLHELKTQLREKVFYLAYLTDAIHKYIILNLHKSTIS